MSGVSACIIRLDSFSVCFPLDGPCLLAARFFCPIPLLHLIRDLWAILGNLCLPLVHSAFCGTGAQIYFRGGQELEAGERERREVLCDKCSDLLEDNVWPAVSNLGVA